MSRSIACSRWTNATSTTRSPAPRRYRRITHYSRRWTRGMRSRTGRRPSPVPITPSSRSCRTTLCGDGRSDLFVGGRVRPRNYPYPARSYLLRNDGGHFTDVTEQVCPELAHSYGMVTDAVWIDFDGDGRLDLVTAGEWMGLEFFKNDGTRLRNATRAPGLPPP